MSSRLLFAEEQILNVALRPIGKAARGKLRGARHSFEFWRAPFRNVGVVDYELMSPNNYLRITLSTLANAGDKSSPLLKNHHHISRRAFSPLDLASLSFADSC